MKKHFILLVPGICCWFFAQSQIMTTNGAIFHISNGATVFVNGGMDVTNTSTLTNNGDLTITKNSTFPNAGTFDLNTGSNVNGNGNYRVEQDWINSATFNAGTSTVELFGNTQQFITSTSATSTVFHNLTLSGTGAGIARKKTLQGVDGTTDATGILVINDRELETQTNSFFVLNPATASVTNTTTPGSEGFVSSLFPGVFSRVTNSVGTYVFPTGSSLGILRYRPIEMIPNNTAVNVYTVRLNNTDPTLDGFTRTDNDGTMCVINGLYYHTIERASGTTGSDIRMFYIPGTDGTWGNMGHWRNASTDWNDMNTVALATSGGFNTVTRNAWNFVNPGDQYVLTNKRPEQPSINCPMICENSSGNIFTLTGSSTNYLWTVPAGGTIVSGQGTGSIDVDWTTGTGYVTVYAVGAGGCNSLPDSCQPTVLPVPVAGFSVSGGYDFMDQSSNATVWYWDFGDGGNSAAQNPTYQYPSGGIYTVVLTASNAAGCSDTATMVIDANESIVIPNVFSPNGDGTNDDYFITAIGMKEYSLNIFNRWGQLMFESSTPNEHWDGKNLSGNRCEDGTYFFTLKAASSTKDYSTHGTITITGSK